MPIINIDAIPTVEVAPAFAMEKLRLFMKEIVSDRLLILAEQNTPPPTTPYVEARPMPISGTPSSSYGNDSIYHEVDDIGTETYIYEYMMPVSLKTYKGNAQGDMLKIRQSLKNRDLWYKYFGREGLVGVRQVTPVANQPTSVGSYTWETGATMIVTLSFLTKEIYTEGGIINTVGGTTEVEDIVHPFESNYPLP